MIETWDKFFLVTQDNVKGVRTREKWLYVSFAYINNLYKTIQQNNKAAEKANVRLPFVQGKIMVLP